MSEVEQRAHEIVEELRADIDFEIDDVISKIVLGLPEDYFRILSHADQMKHLKALLALGVCNVNQEIMMESDDERFIAVVGRKDYPGLLAKILQRLPRRREMVGAKIFTSREHDFIIDLFEFRSDAGHGQADRSNHIDIENRIQAVAEMTGQPSEQVGHFAAQYNPNSPVLDDQNYLASQYVAFRGVLESDQLSVELGDQTGVNQKRLTIASSATMALEVFQKTAAYLAERSCGIEQAVLNDFASVDGKRVSIASFQLSTNSELSKEACEPELSSLLK